MSETVWSGDVPSGLADATMQVIERDGILGGINLREVADRAGVTRANIYHYFGSRRALLRAAIQRRFVEGSERFGVRFGGLPFVERKLGYFRLHETGDDSRLRALLVIDGDDEVDPMPIFEASISDLRQDVIDGHIDKEHDLVAFQVAFSALTRGYQIFRESYARRTGWAVDELDERVAAVVRHWLQSMEDRPR